MGGRLSCGGGREGAEGWGEGEAEPEKEGKPETPQKPHKPEKPEKKGKPEKPKEPVEPKRGPAGNEKPAKPGADCGKPGKGHKPNGEEIVGNTAGKELERDICRLLSKQLQREYGGDDGPVNLLKVRKHFHSHLPLTAPLTSPCSK